MMKLVEIAVKETTVRVRLANAEGPAAKYWIDCELPRSEVGRRQGEPPTGTFDTWEFRNVRELLLENVVRVVQAEIARLKA